MLADRIIPYPDRLDWWIDHGMPQGPALRRLAEDPGRTDTGALAVGPAQRDRQFRQYSLWVKNEGARTYIEWLVTHPTYTLFEPFESPERVHLRRTVTDYSPDANEVPLITRLFFWPWPAAVAAFVVLLGAGIWRRRVSDVTWLVALGLVVLRGAAPAHRVARGWGVPHPGHALLGNVQAILGILVLGLALLPRARVDDGSVVELED